MKFLCAIVNVNVSVIGWIALDSFLYLDVTQWNPMSVSIREIFWSWLLTNGKAPNMMIKNPTI